MAISKKNNKKCGYKKLKSRKNVNFIHKKKMSSKRRLFKLSGGSNQPHKQPHNKPGPNTPHSRSKPNPNPDIQAHPKIYNAPSNTQKSRRTFATYNQSKQMTEGDFQALMAKGIDPMYRYHYGIVNPQDAARLNKLQKKIDSKQNLSVAEQKIRKIFTEIHAFQEHEAEGFPLKSNDFNTLRQNLQNALHNDAQSRFAKMIMPDRHNLDPLAQLSNAEQKRKYNADLRSFQRLSPARYGPIPDEAPGYILPSEKNY